MNKSVVAVLSAFYIGAAGMITGCTSSEDYDQDGYGVEEGDCDDNNPEINPGTVELCNGIDDNCDGVVDGSDAEGASYYYLDADGDGYGDADAAVVTCEQPEGYVLDASDCADDNLAIYPGAEESCDGTADEDCDGTVDEAGAVDAVTWYVDEDADGFGDESASEVACVAPGETYIDVSGDCDDASDSSNPAVEELCLIEGDNDCDGISDESTAADVLPWYLDSDGDRYGDPSTEVWACVAPGEDYVDNGEDCNDELEDVSPSSPELCEVAGDDDCDGLVDEGDAEDAVLWYLDEDEDGYGEDESVVSACESPGTAYSIEGGDCDDGNIDVSPEAIEQCANTIDEDCDNKMDEGGAEGGVPWYQDSDGDGYGNEDTETIACEAPNANYVSDSTDCDDNKEDVNPGATELCDGKKDEDCDGLVDEESGTVHLDWYVDEDGDGYGTGEIVGTSCTGDDGTASNGDDCNDEEQGISPKANETCDGETDEDCDGQVDEADSTNRITYYADSDGDGYGDVDEIVLACEAPGGYVENDDDCDDSDGDINPGQDEICDGEVDEDCDKSVDETADGQDFAWYVDADGDGYGSDETEVLSCTAPSEAYVFAGGDCQDDDDTINPGAEEYCDGIDTDCDGKLDFGYTIPHEYDTIEEAIDRASGGAHLCVGPGIYVENLLVSVPMTLESMNGAEETILDGGGEARVIRFSGGGSSALIGFTLQNGYETGGAGMHTGATTDLLIQDVIVQDNYAESETAVCQGVGLRITGDATLDNVIVQNNTASCASVLGAGILLKGDYALLQNVTVQGNIAFVDDNGNGSLTAWYSSFDAYNIVVAGNEMYDRDGAADINAVGILTQGTGQGTLTNADIVGNYASAGYGEVLGVAFLADSDSPSGISNSLINVSVVGNAADGGSIWSGGYYQLGEPEQSWSFCNTYDNDVDDYGNFDDPTGISGNLAVDAGYVDVSGEEPETWDLTLAAGSLLIDAGDPEIEDLDGSISDIGAFGGPYAGSW